jgi:hypothetical protein
MDNIRAYDNDYDDDDLPITEGGESTSQSEDESSEEAESSEDEEEEELPPSNQEARESSKNEILISQTKPKPKAKLGSRANEGAMRRNPGLFEVRMPHIETRNSDYAEYLDKGRKLIPQEYIDGVQVKTSMLHSKAIYLIAHYCAILNTDPNYMEIFWLSEDGFAGVPPGPYTDQDYLEFRMVFGVCIAHITAYLMHFHIEISVAMLETKFRWAFPQGFG